MEFEKELSQYQLILRDLHAARCVQLEGCVPSQTEHLLHTFAQDFTFTVIIAQDEQKAAEMISNYSAFDREVLPYPARDPMFDKADIQGSFLTEQRAEVVKRICEGRGGTILTTLDAFYDGLESVERIREHTLTIRSGDTLDERELAEKLVSMGYTHETQVGGHGEFSVRGNIIDIYPYALGYACRIDLFGDEVESIRVMDIDSQRSMESVEELTVFPGSEGGSDQVPESSFLEYFRGQNTLFALCEPVRIIKNLMGMNPLAAADQMEQEFREDTDAQSIERAKECIRKITQMPCLLFSSLGESSDLVTPFRSVKIHARNIPSYNGRFSDLVEDLKKYRKDGYRVIVSCAGSLRAENMIKNLAENGIAIGPIEADPAAKVKASDIQVQTGSVRVGFEYPDIRVSVITEVDIFGARKTRRRRKRYSGDPIQAFSDLNIGDYVVHEQHGVGIYEGIERIGVDGTEKDYMKISYANHASLYVLATQFDKIQKYGGSEEAKPKINRLGGKEWTNTKARVRAAVQDIAEDLVKLYAARQMQNGFRFSADTVWQREFEDSFEYDETDDQLQAIEEVKSDMESGRIMDRLICGDVGFGKTEVAIRAAFKAVQDGKQVAFLTPTTILAQQHYNTLTRRLENYPVTVKMLSRFAGAKEQTGTVKGLANGQVDIVVGTHRLLSKDIRFKDLGLLVIDEEQRFGVTHKEKIKQLRRNIDVLTLSATPIPRTLHMSLTGIRDMSLLTEPPIDRLPIQTYVMEYSPEAVREAILRESARGGQVYYVYNRTSNIDLVADTIRQMVPHLNVEFAHGRMASRELERIMFDFIEGTIDVLVSTTIIETGLDIPNVNTIIIHDADNYGLSQLYQLRGRVGRSNRTAYAFLMYRKDKLIREVAEKRLRAIREFSDLGSGIKIALRDLEIRGAGNVLGAEQSGHMEAVGYELYCKMLNQAVAQLKGEQVREDFETTVDLHIDGFIPASYIADEYERLNMYKKISAVTDQEEMEEVREELEDRFGEIPRATDNLLLVAYIKARAHDRYITEIAHAKQGIPVSTRPAAGTSSIRGSSGSYTGKGPIRAASAANRPMTSAVAGTARGGAPTAFKITLLGTAPIDTYKMLDILRVRTDQLRFTPDKAPYFIYQPGGELKNLQEINQTLTEFFDLLDEIIER